MRIDDELGRRALRALRRALLYADAIKVEAPWGRELVLLIQQVRGEPWEVNLAGASKLSHAATAAQVVGTKI